MTITLELTLLNCVHQVIGLVHLSACGRHAASGKSSRAMLASARLSCFSLLKEWCTINTTQHNIICTFLQQLGMLTTLTCQIITWQRSQHIIFWLYLCFFFYCSICSTVTLCQAGLLTEVRFFICLLSFRHFRL